GGRSGARLDGEEQVVTPGTVDDGGPLGVAAVDGHPDARPALGERARVDARDGPGRHGSSSSATRRGSAGVMAPVTDAPSATKASGRPIRMGALRTPPKRRVSSSLVRVTRLTPTGRNAECRSPRSIAGVAAGRT